MPERKAMSHLGHNSLAQEILQMGQPRELRLEIRHLPPGACLLVETLDTTHGFALPAWKAMGTPEAPSRGQVELLRQASHSVHREFFTADPQGSFSLERSLSPWSLLMLREIF